MTPIPATLPGQLYAVAVAGRQHAVPPLLPPLWLSKADIFHHLSVELLHTIVYLMHRFAALRLVTNMEPTDAVHVIEQILPRMLPSFGYYTSHD